MDSVTEVTRVGWGSRLLDAIKGVLFGLLLFAVSFPLLFWNEGRAVRRARDLEEGREAVVEASAAAVNPAQEGHLVHVTGDAATVEALRDPELGPAAQGVLRMRRVVEMYQWQEERRSRSSSNTGGSQTQTTTYTYNLAWSATPVDSSRFHVVEEHENPAMPLQSTSVEAQHATLGARALTPSLVSQVQGFRPLAVLPAQVPALAALGRALTAHENGIYVGANPMAPALGDLRVKWEVAPGGPVSVLAAQHGATFDDWRTPSGRSLEQNLEAGTVTAAAMFGDLEASNAGLTWALRFVGWLLMFLGVLLVVRPLVVVADVLPFLGSLVGAGAGLAAFVIASPLSLVTVAVAWIVYRPLLGAALLAAGVAVAVLAGKLTSARGREKNASRAALRAA